MTRAQSGHPGKPESRFFGEEIDEARPLLMQRFGVPVVTSNQPTIDTAFDAIGVTADWPVAAAA
jgi:hypothetical protein